MYRCISLALGEARNPLGCAVGMLLIAVPAPQSLEEMAKNIWNSGCRLLKYKNNIETVYIGGLFAIELLPTAELFLLVNCHNNCR
jgi:hypothetical protein